MVKLKEGVILSYHQQKHFDYMNALERKKISYVDYFYKRENTYPARVYVFMNAEVWQPRNRRPMALHESFSFLRRPMNKEEIEYHHFNIRLCYHQYENWYDLIWAEEQEAELLNLEKPGSGTEFLEQLRSYQKQYPLAGESKVLKKQSSLKYQLKQLEEQEGIKISKKGQIMLF